MILAPRYSSSEPPPASGPLRSNTTPILIFLSAALSSALAESAMPNSAIAMIGPQKRQATLRISIKPSLENCASPFLVGLATHHIDRAEPCQAESDRRAAG